MFGKKEKNDSLKELGEELKKAGTVKPEKKRVKKADKRLSGKGVGIFKSDELMAVSIQKQKAASHRLPVKKSPTGKSGMLVLPVGEVFHEFIHMPLNQFSNSYPTTLRTNFSRNLAKQNGSKDKWISDYRFLGVEIMQGRKHARLVVMGASHSELEKCGRLSKENGIAVTDFQSIMIALLPMAEKVCPATGQAIVLFPMNKIGSDFYQTAVFFFINGNFWFGRVTSSADLSDPDEAHKFIIRIRQTRSGLDASAQTTWIVSTDNEHVYEAVSDAIRKASNLSGEGAGNETAMKATPPAPLCDVPSHEWPAVGGAFCNMDTGGVKYHDPVSDSSYYPRLKMIDKDKKQTRGFQFRIEVLCLMLVITLCGFFSFLKWQEMFMMEGQISRMSSQTQINRLEKMEKEENDKLYTLQGRIVVPLDFQKDSEIKWSEILNYLAASVPEHVYFEKLSLKRNPTGDSSTWLMAVEGFVAAGLSTTEVRQSVDDLKSALDNLTDMGLFEKLVSFKEHRGEDIIKVSSASAAPSGVYTGLEFTVAINPNVRFKKE